MGLKLIIGLIYSTVINLISCKYINGNKFFREIFAIILFTPIFIKYSGNIEIIYYIFIFSALFLISVIDIKNHIIPNKLVVSILIIGLSFNIYKYSISRDYFVFIDMILGFIIGTVPLFLAIILSKGRMGAGDMKLMGALGLCFGIFDIFTIFTITFIISSIFAIIMIGFKKMTIKSMLPLAPFISLACLVNIFLSEVIVR